MSDEQEWQRKQRDRDRLIEQVELGELAWAEAEAEAARRGMAPLAITPDPNRFDPLKETYWTVLKVLAWIIWHDVDQVRSLSDGYREQSSYWGRRLLPDGTPGSALKSRGKATWLTLVITAADETGNGNPPSQTVTGAREELWRVLEEGNLKATGIDTTTGRRVEIPALDWLELELVENVQDPSKGDEVRRRGLVFGGYRDVRVPSAAVRNCFPAPGEKSILTEAETEAPMPETPPKIGAPTKYDWAAAAGYLFRYRDDYNPQLQAEAVGAMRRWFEKRGKVPHQRDLEKFVSEAFKASEHPK